MIKANMTAIESAFTTMAQLIADQQANAQLPKPTVQQVSQGVPLEDFHCSVCNKVLGKLRAPSGVTMSGHCPEHAP